MPFKKGDKINLGRKATDETKHKMSIARKGHPGYMKGKHHSNESRIKMSKSQLGKKHSEETKQKISEAQKGEKGNNWRGGISFLPYALDWTGTLRRSIRERDKYVCQICSEPQGDLAHCVHHIDYDKQNCNPENLVTLCRYCHNKTNFKREVWLEYFKQKQNE